MGHMGNLPTLERLLLQLLAFWYALFKKSWIHFLIKLIKVQRKAYKESWAHWYQEPTRFFQGSGSQATMAFLPPLPPLVFRTMTERRVIFSDSKGGQPCKVVMLRLL